MMEQQRDQLRMPNDWYEYVSSPKKDGPQVPYLKPKDEDCPRLTLVLDLDETLIHYDDPRQHDQTFESAD